MNQNQLIVVQVWINKNTYFMFFNECYADNLRILVTQVKI